MSMYDWNHNGKKDGVDDFLEYQIYKDTTNKNNVTPRCDCSQGLSWFGVVLSFIGGLVLETALFAELGIDVADVPTFVLVVLLGVFTLLISFVVKQLGL